MYNHLILPSLVALATEDILTGYLNEALLFLLAIIGFLLFPQKTPMFILTFVAGYIFYYIGGIGGGDVKLFSALSFFLEPYQLFLLIGVSGIFAAFYMCLETLKENKAYFFLFLFSSLVLLLISPLAFLIFILLVYEYLFPKYKQKKLRWIEKEKLDEEEIVEWNLLGIKRSKKVITYEEAQHLPFEKLPVYRNLPPYVPFITLVYILITLFPPHLLL